MGILADPADESIDWGRDVRCSGYPGTSTRPRDRHDIEQPDRRGRRQRAPAARHPVSRRHDRRDRPEWGTLRDDLDELQQPARTGGHF